jgi:hypothetical protein
MKQLGFKIGDENTADSNMHDTCQEATWLTPRVAAQ